MIAGQSAIFTTGWVTKNGDAVPGLGDLVITVGGVLAKQEAGLNVDHAQLGIDGGECAGQREQPLWGELFEVALDFIGDPGTIVFGDEVGDFGAIVRLECVDDSSADGLIGLLPRFDGREGASECLHVIACFSIIDSLDLRGGFIEVGGAASGGQGTQDGDEEYGFCWCMHGGTWRWRSRDERLDVGQLEFNHFFFCNKFRGQQSGRKRQIGFDMLGCDG